MNKHFEVVRGEVSFEYRALRSDADNPNLLFCMIPMRGNPIDLLEVGAKSADEPANAYSPYRVRYYIPKKHLGDNAWHQVSVAFDFSEAAEATPLHLCAANQRRLSKAWEWST